MHRVERRLVAGVGVDGGHVAVGDADQLVKHLGDRGQAIGGARAVRDDVVFGLQRLVVDAVDDGVVGAVGRGRDQHPLGAGGEQQGRLVARGEDAGAFHGDVDAQLLIGKLRGVFDRRHFDLVGADRDCVAGNRHGVREAAMDAVEAQQMGVGLNRPEVVDGDHFDVRAARLIDGAQNIAPDAPEPVDRDTNRHVFLLKSKRKSKAL